MSRRPTSGRYSDDDSYSSPDRSRPGPRRPPPSTPRPGRRRSRPRGYSFPPEKGRRSRNEITLRLCVFNQSNHSWRTENLKFDPYRTNDRELWSDIRGVYRDELQKPWRRILGFKKLKHILPIEYTENDTPIRTDEKDFPDGHTYMHCYHHPEHIRTHHKWIDWFVNFDRASPDVMNGLEFKEGLWADKLAAIAIILTIAIIVASAVWCALGGDLQTVFTVMSFVLSGVAAEIALVALYFQVTMSN